jgi:hypothetical protein
VYLDSREAEKARFWRNLTQFFSKEQSKHFSQARLAQKSLFARITKSFVAEMTPPQKLSQRALRKELRQNPMRFSVAWSATGPRKMAQFRLEKFCVRAISLLCSFSWLHWLLAGKRA